GPPGCGKTTIAKLLSGLNEFVYEPLSAVFSGVADLRKVFERAKLRQKDGLRTLLFVDEIHRFNRAQQDSFLSYVEDGTVTLVGATTENPSFHINSSLLSRCQVLILKRIDESGLEKLINRAEIIGGRKLPIDYSAREALIKMVDGDGRYVLNLVEELFTLPEKPILDVPSMFKKIQSRALIYDKSGEAHYNLISALHKSIRGSDVDAALYWLARMLEGGEDPYFICRRLIRCAAEDIGMADPQALLQAVASWQSYERLGSPEGELAIAYCVIYLATSPKSNSVYKAFGSSLESAKSNGSLIPPKHILNAPTQLLKDIGYGEEYSYDHSTKEGFSGQNYFPDGLERQTYYKPTERGFEVEISKRLSYWKNLRDK
ncbi:MAG: replication-associated recombination protein A, partial [Alphaproteobacteria bacterium]|nr:replication-associated recombination protein A [Alphaproteobacteria bacterium]